MENKADQTHPRPVTSLAKVYAMLRERWPDYVLEIFVIIFSITISFALDEWKDVRTKQELEQTFLKGLASDIQADTSRLREVIDETLQVIRTAS